MSTKKIVKKVQKHLSYKRGSLMKAVTTYIDKVGVDKVDYESMLKIAKTIKPNTKFNKAHFAWYKNNYRLSH